MGFDLSSLVGKQADLDITFMDQKATVSYDPSVLTQDLLVNAQKGDQSFLEVFCTVVVDWDVTNGGVKVPIKEKDLGAVPQVFLRHVFREIVQNAGAGELGKVSNRASRRAARSGKSRSSTGTSRRRAT